MSARLQDKVAIVTGAASGIGAACAEAMAREGAHVIVADLNRERAEEQAQRIAALGGTALALRVDLADADSIAAMIESVERDHGRIDVLHNNAANTVLSATRDAEAAELDVGVWDALMHVNLRGTFIAIKAALPGMIARGKGSIVNTVSVSGQGGGRNTAYGVGKAGLIQLTRQVATQYGKRGVRCNAIAPGIIVTPATQHTYAASPMKEIMQRHHLTPRLGLPEDIAHAAVYLASDEAAFVTGQVLNVDGGLLAHLPYSGELAELMTGLGRIR